MTEPGNKHHATHHASLPRRSRRQPVALARAACGAPAARARRDRRRRAPSCRGPRDHRPHPQAGGGRPHVDHRRRVPARVLADRFPHRARRRRIVCRRAQVQVPGAAAAADPAAPQRKARPRRRSSDDRALPFRRAAHQGDAEDDHSVAVDAAFPLRARSGAVGDLSDDGRVLRRSRHDLPQGGARIRGRGLPLSPARRGQPRLSVRSGAARPGALRAATIRRPCRWSMPT